MGDVMTFLGGIVALAVLGFLLFFELSRESMVFAYVISAIIILVLGAMLLSLRGAIGRGIGALAGRLRPKAGGPEIPKGKKPGKPDLPKPSGLPRKLSNPMLKDLMKRIKEKKAGEPERGGPEEMEQPKPEGGKASRLSGLLRKFRGIGGKLKIRGARKPEARAREMEEIKEKLAEMDELEEEVEGPELEKMEEALEEKTEGRKPPRKPKEEPAKAEARTEGVVSCQICGSTEGLQEHYIVPLEKGGSEDEGNIIMLCRKHKKQAEEGVYSENLLRRMKDI